MLTSLLALSLLLAASLVTGLGVGIHAETRAEVRLGGGLI